MLKVFKYLKKSSFIIFIIILLLAGQASCELSLPTYTSNIINIGIQQGGIENSVPDVIRKSAMDNLFIFLNKKDKGTVLDNYKLLSKDSLSSEDYKTYKESYPALKDEELYLLNTKDKEKIEKLDNILAKPELIVYGLESNDESSKMIQEQMKNNMNSNIPSGNVPNGSVNMENMDMFALLESMPQSQRDKLIEEMDNKLVDLPEAMISQGAVSFVKGEYSDIGIDTNNLQTKYIITTGLKMLGITVLSMVASITVGFLASRVAASLGRTLRSKTFEKVMRFSSKEMTEFSTASLITRSTNDIQQIQQMTVMMLRMVFFAPFMAIGGIYKALTTNVSMSWVIGVAVLCVVLIVAVLFTTVMPRFKVLQNLVDKLNLVTREILTGLPVIRAFSTERFEENRFDGVNKDLTKVNMFVNRMMSCMMPMMMFVMNAISVLIVWVGAKNIDTGAMQVGDMMAFIQYTMQIVMSFLMISAVSIMIPRASVSAKRVNEVLEKDIIIKEDEKPKAFDESKKGLVEFKNVSFQYPDADEKIIHNISFTAKPGETTAFIGSTGSGKSTLINLIPRFHDVTEGSISVDGVNIKDVSTHDLREKIGYVPQKGILFSGTIDSNLRYGNKDASEDDIIRAAKIAQSIDFINDKEDKFDSEIAQGGSNVSGGQKQRLSIARAIAKDPEIFIFDDSFSALDFKTDAKLRKALKSETKDATVLIVAQRISTILDADQIVVLDEGRVVGIGKHNELLKNCEVYKEIALSQLSKEELDNE